METINDYISKTINYLATIRIADMLDILVVAGLIYILIVFIRRTNSYRVARGIIFLFLAMWITGEIGLTMINSLLRTTFELGLIALVIIFQPELRRVLERVGSGRLSYFFGEDINTQTMESAIVQTILACEDMAGTKTGALIVFERNSSLNDQMSTGTIINSDITAELLRNIFYPKAPLHDGAVIIRDSKIAAAGCMLPLSQNASLSRDLGMRHRAGIGMSEHSDSVVVMVSEETGYMSVAVDGMLKRHLSSEMMEKILRSELIQDDDVTRKRGIAGFIAALKVKINDK